MTSPALPFEVAMRVSPLRPIPPDKNTAGVWMGEAIYWYEQHHQLRTQLEELHENATSRPAQDKAGYRAIITAIENASTPQQMANASRTLAVLLVAGDVSPEQGRTALYALQISLSALRIAEQSHAARQKEERLRSQKRTPPRRSRNPQPPQPRRKK